MHLTATQKRNIITLNILIPFLLGTGIDLYVPSLPAITDYFHTTSHLTQITISLYMLGYAIGQFLFGILSDSLGRRKILILCTLFFTVFSFLSIDASSIALLNIYRLIQGLSVGGMSVLSRAITTDCFSGKNLTKVLTYNSSSWALGPILGPLIGGYLQHYFNWQADFYFFGIFGLILLIYAFITLPETNQHFASLRPKRIYQITKIVITHPFFLLVSIILALVYAAIVIFNVVGPFLIQVTLKYSAVDYGHAALLLGTGYFLGNVTNRFLINRLHAITIVLWAILGALCTSAIMVILALFIPLNLWIILAPSILFFYFCGFTFPNLMSQGLAIFPKVAGTANAVFGLIIITGVFLMSLFATTLKTNTFLPLAITDLVVLVIILILFMFAKRLDPSCQSE